MERAHRILVVDSKPDFVETARKALETSFEVALASSLKEGLKKARGINPDLIILGYLEPRGSSFRLHNELRAESVASVTKNIPLLVVDVSPEEHSRKGWRREEGMQMDAEDYVPRPVEPGELKGMVDRILRKAQPKSMDFSEVLQEMEGILNRIDKIEKSLIR